MTAPAIPRAEQTNRALFRIIKRRRGDFYVLTSPDCIGLHVVNKDEQKALDDVGPALQMLVKLNSGQECQVLRAEKMDGGGFLAWRMYAP